MRLSRSWLTPPGLLVVPLLLSLAMWAVPWSEGVRTGFYSRAHLSGLGVVVLAVWYGSATTAAWLGYRIGRLTPTLASIDRVSSSAYHRYFTLLALAGVFYTYFYIYRQNPGLILESLRGTTFNNVRAVLPYDSGIQTLRYASTVSGAFAIVNIARSHRPTPIDVLNVCLLLATAAISSRLSLMLSALIVVAVMAREIRFESRARVIFWGSVGATTLVLALTAANYYRNAGFYAQQYNQNNAFAASLYEAVTYLAAPFNASVATSSHAAELSHLEISRLPANSAQFVVPAYLPVVSQPTGPDQSRYREYVDMEPTLTTNSALASMYSALGVAAFLVMPVVLFATALFVGHAFNYQSRFYVAGFILSYGFAEFWRVYLFNAGIVHFLVLAFIAAPVLIPGRERRSGTLGRGPRRQRLPAQVR